MTIDLDYDIKAMKEALKKCDENIKVFEQAIFKEMNTKMEYQRIIRFLEEKESLKQEMDKKVHLEVVRVSEDEDIDGEI